MQQVGRFALCCAFARARVCGWGEQHTAQSPSCSLQESPTAVAIVIENKPQNQTQEQEQKQHKLQTTNSKQQKHKQTPHLHPASTQAEFVQNKDRTCSLAFRLARDVNKNKPIAGV
jgi:chromosomal replication initiation ATPase DnaA